MVWNMKFLPFRAILAYFWRGKLAAGLLGRPASEVWLNKFRWFFSVLPGIPNAKLNRSLISLLKKTYLRVKIGFDRESLGP